ncbi:uncharacterized protein LOC132564440 [Ylistrum balloti]|uniref:uncharacterized protein LOC132564440 n=1 Tax=Ylistrum balloti TaxID=509963 RepID=UPI002905B8DC|nr:uncharacterized protein LOC132564440 [Ylistrum balloti]
MFYLLFSQSIFLIISQIKVARALCEWIGVLHHFAWVETLLILFENISSLQGMFVSLSFSCNNRVYKFYRYFFSKTK